MLKEVSLEIIQKCLNNCIYCSSNSCHNSKPILELNVVKEVIDDICYLGAKKLCLSGGEPFLHKDILRIIEYATNKGLEINIYSSGIVGTSDNKESLNDDILIKAKEAGLSKVIFNLQGSNAQTYDVITKTNNNFPLVIKSIKKVKKANIKAEIHFVPMKQNVKEIDGIINLSKELNIDKINFLRLVPHGRALSNKKNIMLNDEELINIQKKLYDIKKSGEKIRIGLPLSSPENKITASCHAIKEKLYIKFDGNVYGCEAFKYIEFFDKKNNPITPDNILTKRVKDIYKNSLFLTKSKDLIRNFSNKKCGCENCSVQKYLKEKI